MANDFIKIAKGNFPTGSMSVYINKLSTTDREIVGKVVVKLSYPSFVKGVWVKLVGINTVVGDNLPYVTHDLFAGDEDHYKDGFHQVLIGFGDGDNCHGTYLELSTGRHSWPFYFKLPYYAPATYSDWKTSIRYKLITTFESPIVQSSNSRLTLNHEHVAPNYSNFLYVRIKEIQKVENRELLQSGRRQYAQQEDNQTGNHRILPSIMNMIRTPTKLSIQYNPGQCVLVSDGNNSHSGQCAMFPFLTNRLECEILCGIENLRTRFPVLIQCELYSEVCTRSSAKHPFHASYPVVVGAPNSALDEAGSPMNLAQHKPHSSCTTRLLWEGGMEVPPQQAEQVTLTVPIDIDTAPRSAAISAKPFPLPVKIDLYPGKIVQYSFEAPLYRHRTMLKVSVLRTDGSKQAICSPVFGEICILPPKPESDAPISTSHAVRSAVPINTLTSSALPDGLPAARRPSSGNSRHLSNGSAAASLSSAAELEPTVPSVAPAGIAALDIPTLVLPPGAEETMQPSPVLAAVGAQSYISPRPTSAASVPVAASSSALVPTRPISGTNRAGRALRNHGGVASFRAAHSAAAQSAVIATAGVAVPCTGAPGLVGTDTENQHPNTARTSTAGPTSRTPHAKPTQCGHVIRVDAEVLSRGPAAVLMDRSERRTEPIRTPQRFAVMYHVEVANAIDGTPIAIAPTPVAISTAEYRAVRRSLNMPTDTPEPPHLQGFQFYETGVHSSAATPQQVLRSYDSSFDASNLEDSSRLGTARRNSRSGIFEDAGLESTDQVRRFEGVEVAEETPRQRQLFRETFNGIDYLASHTHLAIAQADAADERVAQGPQSQAEAGDITVPNTQRSTED